MAQPPRRVRSRHRRRARASRAADPAAACGIGGTELGLLLRQIVHLVRVLSSGRRATRAGLIESVLVPVRSPGRASPGSRGSSADCCASRGVGSQAAGRLRRWQPQSSSCPAPTRAHGSPASPNSVGGKVDKADETVVSIPLWSNAARTRGGPAARAPTPRGGVPCARIVRGCPGTHRGPMYSRRRCPANRASAWSDSQRRPMFQSRFSIMA